MSTQNTMRWVDYAQNYQEKWESIVQKIIWCIGSVKKDISSIQNISPELLQLQNILGGISQLDRSFSNDFNPYLRCTTVGELFEAYESIKRSNSNSTRVKHMALLKFACKEFSQR